MKDDSLYSMGMKPFVFSTKKNQDTGSTWHRNCFNIEYIIQYLWNTAIIRDGDAQDAGFAVRISSDLFESLMKVIIQILGF